MKRLLMMRHAEASHAASTDHGRELTEQGREQATGVGMWLRGLNCSVDAIVASTAVRTMQTAGLVRDQLFDDGVDSEDIQQSKLLYNAPASVWLDVVADFPSDWDDVLVIGHNPAVQHLTTAFVGGMVPVTVATLVDVRLDQWDTLGDSARVAGVFAPGGVDIMKR